MADGKVIIDSEINDKGIDAGLANIQGKLSTAGKKLNDIGRELSVKLTAPIMAAGTGALLLAKNFDDSMRKVEATLGGNLGKTAQEVEKNIKSLRDEAQRLGATTAFSASDAAAGMEKLALAGWNVNQILEATGPMLNLASAAAMSLDQAADIVTDTMAAFQMEASEAAKAADIFAATSSNSNTDVIMLGEAMKYAGAAANAAGMDLEQTNAILGKLADQGIKGSAAGNTFTAMLRDVKKNAEDGAIAIGDTSVAVYDTAGNMRDLTSILIDVEKATKGMTGAQRDAALSNIFGEQAIRGVNIALATGAENIRDFEEVLRESAGTSAEMAAHMEGGIGGAFRAMNSALEGLAINIGNVLVPYVQMAAEKIGEFAGWLTSLDEEKHKLIVTIGLVVAAIGPLLMIVSTLLNIMAKAIQGFQVLGVVIGALTSPIGLVVVAIAALVAAFIYLWHTNEEVREAMGAAWDWIQEHISIVIEELVEFIQDMLEKILQFWEENGKQIMDVVKVAFDFVKKVINTVMPFILSLIKQVWNNIKGIIEGTLNAIMGIVKLFASILTGDWKGAWEAVKQIVTGVIQAVWNYIELMLIGRVMGVVRNFFSLFTGAFRTGMNTVSSTVSNIFNNILSNIRGLGSRFVDAGRNIVSSIVDGIRAMANRPIEAMRNITSRLRDMLPFSPAKEGPLKDLNKLDFAGPIMDSIKLGMPKVQAKFASMFNIPPNPEVALAGTRFPSDTSSGDGNGNIGKDGKTVIEVPVNIDGREVARATARYTSNEQYNALRNRSRGRGTK